MFFKKDKGEKLYAPIDGIVKPITETPDQVFSQRMMGDGFCIEPANGIVVSPVDGKITTVFPTKHAIGITSKSGLELIIHFGVDTVALNGEGFKSKVEAGQKIKKGAPILEVDIEAIKDKVPSLITPVVVTNLEGRAISIVKEGHVKKGDEVITIK